MNRLTKECFFWILWLICCSLLMVSCEKDKIATNPTLEIEWISIRSNLTFQMGDIYREGDEREQPVHTVTLSPYQIGRYEISNKEYCQFLNEAQETKKLAYRTDRYHFKGSTVPAAGSFSGDTLFLHIGNSRWYYYFYYEDSTFKVNEGAEDLPVTMVTHAGAKAFARFYGWRLPTEAEWERAAKGPDPGRRYPWGDELPDCNLAIYNSGDTNAESTCYDHPMFVHSCQGGISAEGCFNMAGNVWEYCSDFQDKAYYTYSPEIDPKGPETGPKYIMRGGSVYDNYKVLRTSHRGGIPEGERHSNIGFRVVRKLPD